MHAAAVELSIGDRSQVVLSFLTPFAPNGSIKARTSGVLLVAGVGSFFAYRVASNLLGNRFVWECLEAGRFDRIPSADRRCLYSFNTDEEDEEEHDQEEEEQDDRRSCRSRSLVRLNRSRRSMRGLIGSLRDKPPPTGVVSRRSASSLRIGSASTSSLASTKSAALQLVWEGGSQAWDDYDLPTQECRQMASTSSDIYGDMCSVFNDVLSVTSFEPEMDLDELSQEQEIDRAVLEKCRRNVFQSFVIGTSEAGDVQDPKHLDEIEHSREMYDSAIGAEIASNDGGSSMEHPSSSLSLEWCDEIGARVPMDHASSLDGEVVYEGDVDNKFAPEASTTRDLMVMACEVFQPFSPPFKTIQSLYHKRRLKRVGCSGSSTLGWFIQSALYHRIDLLHNIQLDQIRKRLESALNECDFLHKWHNRTPSQLRQDVDSICRLVSAHRRLVEHAPIGDEHTRGLECLLVLEAKRAYDEKLAGLFCEDWLDDIDSPADVMKLIEHRQLPSKIMWNLLCRLTDASIEVIQVRSMSSQANHDRYGGNRVQMSWLSMGKAQPMPLFRIPSDID